VTTPPHSVVREQSREQPIVSDTRARIVDAAVRCTVRHGVAATSMAVIATEAGVSKALLHYHFADRSHLLAATLDRLAQRIGRREAAARDSRHGESAVDALWRWVEGELQRGELRALLTLATLPDASVRDAATRAATARRTAAEETVAAVFERLGLTPRVPPRLVAKTNLAFINGLALGTDEPATARTSFDVLWLALLSLTD